MPVYPSSIRAEAEHFGASLRQMRAHGHLVRPTSSPGSLFVSDVGRMTMVELVRFAQIHYGAWHEDPLLDHHTGPHRP